MANDGQIVFEVTADGKHAIADIKSITSAIQKETKKWDDSAEQSANNISNSFSGMLKKLVAGFSAVKIGQALLNIGKDALEAASDLQEVQNVVDVTFGDSANKVERWAKEAGNQFGLSETKAKQFASTMGAMLKSSGFAADQITDVSTSLAGLAADMSSFYNLDFDTAFQKIRSGIAGETEPLKQLGINMSVANLNAYALKQGLEKTFEQMSSGEQTMLRYQYLMEATSDAQGDFARTSDGYANSMRTLQSNLEGLKATLGKAFIDVCAEATGALNGFISLLMPDESKRTVLDDFADIDLKTDTKLEQIKKTASQANSLASTLDEIGGSKANLAGSKIQQFADSISNINLEQGKSGIVKDFLSTLAANVTTLSDITGQSSEGLSEWLEQVGAAAESLSPEDAEGWEKLISSIKEGLPGLEDTEFGSAFFSALGDGFDDVSKGTSVLEWAINSLGDKTNRTAEEQALWLETCKRLVTTIPGLSSIINTETGEVKGGTQAVKDYVKAWEEGQEKLAMMNLISQKEAALQSRFADIWGLKLDKMTAERQLKKAKNDLMDIALDVFEGVSFDEEGNFLGSGGNLLEVSDEQLKSYEEAKDKYEKLLKTAKDATEAYERQAEALKEAEEILNEEKATVEEMPGEIEKAEDATEKWYKTIGKTSEEVTTLVNNVETLTKELADYVKSVRDSTESAVNSTVKGFESIETPMQEAARKTKDVTDKLLAMGNRTSDNADEWDKLNNELNNYNENTITAGKMGKNLEDQVKYMEEYIANLEKARELGVSDEVLAQLSDGSEESFDYLAALANATPDEVEKINDNYQKVIEKKKELTDQLTGQKLSADEVYKSMAQAAKDAVAELDLEQTAADNAGKTVAGIATGISSHVPEVETAVNSIIEQLNRLNSWGISIDLGDQFGTLTFSGNSGKTETPDAVGLTGIDFVPRDNWYARLHEGERVLTAEENRVYNALRSGISPGVDLDSLGGVMRDNIKAGGNVYLNGTQVGRVVSDQQGRSYRSLQRSGWQA